MTPEERAKEILAPLLNPEPHPLQEEWSETHSMWSADLVGLVAAAIRAAVEQEREECAKRYETEVARLKYELETVRLYAKSHYMQVNDLVTGETAKAKAEGR